MHNEVTTESTTPTSDRTAQIVAMVLRMLLMGGAALAIAWPLTPNAGRWAAVAGAVLGVWAGERSGRSRLRLWVLALAPLVGLLFLYLWTQAWVTWDWPSQWLGWATALDTAEAMRWGGGCLLVIGALRAYGRRNPALNALELLLPLLAAASLLSAHREGQIHRPQQLADWALEQGQDPTWYLLLLGLGGALFLAFGLLRLRRSSQLLGGLALIALLFTFGLWGLSELPYRAIAQNIRKLLGEGNKKDKKKKAKAKPKQGQGQGKRRKKDDNQDNMPFQPPKKDQEKNRRRRPVAVVVFRSDYKPASGVYYFRQQALSQYNGVRMVETHNMSYDRDRAFYFPSADASIKLPRSIEWDNRPKTPTPKLYQREPKAKKDKKKPKGKFKSMDRATRSFLKFFYGKKKKKKKKKDFVTVTTQVSLLRKHQHPFGLVSPRTLRSLSNPNRRLFLRSYEVASKAWNGKWDLKVKFGETYWPKSVWKHYTQAPDDPRYRKLQKTILAQLKNSPYRDNIMAKAYTIKTWLENNAAYSMRIQTPQNIPDHVAHFLFKTRIGYCVHFSHAAVYLFRLIGVPARISEGYAAPARYRGGSSALLLRSAEAHAWPEVYVRSVGWVPLDIQPKRSLDPVAQQPDPDLRRLFSNLARPNPKPPGKESPYMLGSRRSIPWGPIFGGIVRFVRNTVVILALLTLLFAFLLKWIRRFGYLAMRDGPRRLTWYYRSVLDRLSELGVLREPGEPLEPFAQRHKDQLPSLALVTERLVALRFGSQLPSSHDDKELLRQLQRDMRAAYPWVRRGLQLLRPFAWSRHVWQQWRYNPPPALQKWRAFLRRAGAFLRRTLPIFRRSPA